MPSHARKHQLEHSLIYHVYSRSCNHQIIFDQREDFQYFINLLRNYCLRFEVCLYHWVIMSTHYHLVIELSQPEIISKMMAGLHKAYSNYHHRVYCTSGFLWQGRFKMQPIQKELYLIVCGRYVERNPVRAGMVKVAHDYEYSSAKYYCLGIPDNLTVTDPYFTDLNQDIFERQQKYQMLLQNFDKQQEDHFSQPLLPRGNTEFIKRLILKDGHLFPRRKGRT